MTGRRRTHLLLVLLLAIGGFGATGAYVAFGPSATTSRVIFTATGHSQGGADFGHRQPGSSSSNHQERPQRPAGGHGHGVIPATGHGHGSPGSDTFGVRVGRVSGLYPGGSSPLRVKYRNPNGFTLDVTRVVVTTPGAPGGCGAQYFVTGTYRMATPVHVSPHRSVKTTVPFGMKKSAPDACQAVQVSVDVTATAVQP